MDIDIDIYRARVSSYARMGQRKKLNINSRAMLVTSDILLYIFNLIYFLPNAILHFFVILILLCGIICMTLIVGVIRVQLNIYRDKKIAFVADLHCMGIPKYDVPVHMYH